MRKTPIFALVWLLFCGQVNAFPRGGALNPAAPTGQSGNGFGGYAGYNWLCGLDGCFSAAMNFVVPTTVQYDSGGASGNCGGASVCAYIWPGVGDNTNLAQDGVAIWSDGAGGFSYRAWWECFPVNNVQYTFDAGATLNPSAGDTVTASVSCTNCTPGMAPPGTTSWTFTVNDVTKGQSVSETGYNCPMLNNSLYQAFWTTETGGTSNVNFGNLTISSATVNGGNPSFVQTVHTRCTAPANQPCARYEFATGTGNTGSTINVSVPNATTNGFKLCPTSNGVNSGGTTNYAVCSAPP